MLQKLFLSLVILTLVATGSHAEEIGRATINGRTVIIDGAGTWAYENIPAGAAAQAVDCSEGRKIQSKKIKMSLCIAPPWRLDSSPPESMEMQAINKDIDLYFGLVTERTPIPLAGLRKAILYNAAQATGVREEDIEISTESKSKIGSHEWSYIEYKVTFSGANFRFANYYASLGDKGLVQSVFWCAESFFAECQPAILKFMSTVEMQ
jgi:hypothetical protein